MRRTTGVAAFVAFATLAVLPSIASAAKPTIVWAGPPPTTGGLSKSFMKKYNPDVNAFFAKRTTVTVGSSVSFNLVGFHTVDFPGKAGGGLPLPLLVPGATATGVNDAAGVAFWFDGKVPSIGLNPTLFAVSGPKKYNGSTRIDSGLPLSAKVKPLVVQFTAPGTYKYFCDVHPGMVGTVVVKPKGQAVPTPAQNATAITKQATTAVKVLKSLVTAKQSPDTVHLGEAGPGGAELYGMFPSTLNVSAGTVVTFSMTKDSLEDHTATFGDHATLAKLAKGFEGANFPAQGVYPSDPTQPIQESPTQHGDGFANVGVLDESPATTTIQPSSKIVFTAPGTYQFICLIHPFMHGTIIVK
jgi:plastocyanin